MTLIRLTSPRTSFGINTMIVFSLSPFMCLQDIGRSLLVSMLPSVAVQRELWSTASVVASVSEFDMTSVTEDFWSSAEDVVVS